MKKLSLIILVLCFSQLTVSSQSCLPEGITFTTQSQIDSFQINYPGCTEIEGNVLISGNDITNLDGLLGLDTIGGALTIGWFGNPNPLLNNIAGLDSLSFVAGNLSIVECHGLTALNGLENLVYLGGDLYFYDNENLSIITGLNTLSSIGGGLRFHYVWALTEITGFNTLSSLGGDLRISGGMSDLSFLNSLDTIGGGLWIAYSSLVSLEGLENLMSVRDVHIGSYWTQGYQLYCEDGFNPFLKSLTGLSNLSTLEGDLIVTCNKSLSSLGGLENISSISGNLIIAGNDSLTSLDGLSNLNIIGGDLEIGKHLMVSTNQFMGNSSLTDLNGLNNLTNIGGTLNIGVNESLISLAGLENLSHIGENLTIAENSSLAYCEVQGICEYLSSPGGVVSIMNNANGCDSPGEIANSCGFSMPCLPYGNYYITSQTEIDSFQFWYPDCNSLTGYVLIQGDDINNLDGLNHITSVEGVLYINENPVLIDLDGMDNLSSIEGSLYIKNNPLLLNLLGLSNLTLISDGSLLIRLNTSLLSLSGLDNIMVASIDEININGNPLLSHCDIESVCKFLANSFGYASIFNNASGCNSEEEVEEACGITNIHEQLTTHCLSLFPNPANQELNISAEGFIIDEVTIYTLTGQQLLRVRPEDGTIDISQLQPGMYIVEVMVESTRIRQKLLVE